ncbi:MAG: hypothetical protein U9R79_02880 [Armatimonadota bacterium]|nr:hypothetical protein [Armatimonadota bacterium]
MAFIIAAVIAVAVGLIAGLLARRAERRPPAWAVGLAGASLTFATASIPLSAWLGPVTVVSPPVYADRLFTVNVETGQKRTLVRKPGRYGACAWSPDGTRVAVNGYTEDQFAPGVLLVDVRTGQVTRLEGGSQASGHVLWSPDGTQIAFPTLEGSIIEGTPPHEMRWNLLMVDVEGGETRELLPDDQSYLFDPVWSPDGTTIACRGDDSSGGDPMIELVSVADGAIRRLDTDLGCVPHVSWSPDGRELAVSGTGEKGDGIYVVPTDGGDARPSAVNEGTEPVWSPKEDTIAYVGALGDEIRLVSPTGGSDRRLCSVPGVWLRKVWSLTWSPDGSRLAFGVYRADWPEILVADAGTGEVRSVATVYVERTPVHRGKLPSPIEWLRSLLPGLLSSGASSALRSSGPGSIMMPSAFSWSPDSTQIVFASTDPAPEIRQRLVRAAQPLLLVLFAAAAPVALGTAIWTWRRQGRSLLTVLCVVGAGLPTALELLIIWAMISTGLNR